MTSLTYICTMEKALVKIIFGRKSFIFKIFVALLKTFGMQKENKITVISLEMIQERVICKKAVCKEWCLESKVKFRMHCTSVQSNLRFDVH